MSGQPLKVGLIVDGDSAPEYVRDLAAWGRAQERVKVTHFIVQNRPTPVAEGGRGKKLVAAIARRGLRGALQAALWSLIARFEGARLKREGDYRGFLRDHSLEELGIERVDVPVDVSKSGLIYRYPREAIDRIGSLGLDVLIRCGSGILRGEILRLCPYGILSFHHGDSRVNRGSPSGFWEVYNREATTGFVIQRLTEELDGGDVLVAGNIPTQRYYALNRAKLYRKASIFLQRLLTAAADDNRLPERRDDTPYFNRLYRSPGIGAQLRYLWDRYVVAAARRGLRQLSGRKPRWGVAYLACEDWAKATFYKAKRLPSPRTGFLADPFLAQRNGEPCLFVEEFDDAAGRAHISAFGLGGSTPPVGVPALREPFHLSFPFLFEVGERLFMCPESAENRDIRIYECTRFPDQWSLHSVPFTGVSAVDTMIFPALGHWWLLSNIDSADIGDRSELHLFRADDPLAGSWVPHARNPVLFNSSVARNGGILFRGDRLYRVCQRHGFGTYGTGMLIREITALSLDDYCERDYCEIEPGFFDGLNGAHTLSANAGYVAFDYLGRGRNLHG